MRYPIIIKSAICLLLAFAIHATIFGQSEKKDDIVLKLNGEELKGDVIEIGDSSIRFTYRGEKTVYTIKKTDISQITFASGRIEKYNNPPASPETGSGPAPSTSPSDIPATSGSTAEERRNKVAILPFTFVQDGQNAAQEVSEQVQNECYALLSKHPGVYKIVSPRAINVRLNKAGITKENMLNYTMAEICQILGVEYVLAGAVTQNKTTQTSYGSNSYSNKNKENDNGTEQKSSGAASTYSTNIQNYQTVMDMKIYNDKSEVIYNQNRKAFWKTQDAYKNTLEYLVKRCPLYKK